VQVTGVVKIGKVMPYIRKGKCVYRRDTGKKVGCSKSADKAKKYLKKLYMVESNFNKTFNLIIERYGN
jgi:hypothetical protein